MTKTEFENVLVDVRKAYRLLYLYQRRVMDLVQFIGDSLAFRYSGGYPMFSKNTPKEGKGNLDDWAWDWINMYFYEFRFLPREFKDSKIHFSVFIQSDTGYYDKSSEEPLEVDSFAGVDIASTRLIFIVGANISQNNYDDVKSESNPLYKSDSVDYIFKEHPQVLVAKSYPLSEFISAESTLKSLESWIEFCRGNGIIEISINKQ